MNDDTPQKPLDPTFANNVTQANIDDSDAEDKLSIMRGMSDAAIVAANETASEPVKAADEPIDMLDDRFSKTNDIAGGSIHSAYEDDSVQPSLSGQESISGTESDPESDDDTLANAQAMGMQLGEDEEHPEELDIARDIDEAEESLRTH